MGVPLSNNSLLLPTVWSASQFRSNIRRLRNFFVESQPKNTKKRFLRKPKKKKKRKKESQ